MGEPIAWILGAVPPWMHLGPPQVRDGIECHEVLGDFSERHPEDRPPKYVSFGWQAPDRLPEFDRSEGRAPLRQRLPGKDISELKNKHTGAVALLFNGPSLAQWDFHSLGIPTIGLNRTHKGNPALKGYEPDYLCVIDDVWLRVPTVVSHPKLINGSIHVGNNGYRVMRSNRMAPFSFDLSYDGYVCPAPCTTGHLALQAAVYFGFTEIYCLGMDMQGAHFDGSPGVSPHFYMAINYHKKQIEALKLHRPDVKVWVCGSPESKSPFPKVDASVLTGKRAA